MRVRSHRPSRRIPRSILLAALLGLACDPPSAERSKDDELLRRGAQVAGTRDPVADAALGEAKVIVREDGTVEVYDRNGVLRTQVIDPQARFVATLEPLAGAKEWTRPHPQLSVPLAGLSDWLTRRGNERRTRAKLEAEGLTESQRTMIAIAEAAETTEQALAALDGELAALWTDTRMSAAERRRLLFQRWDESAETDAAPKVARVEQANAAPDAIRAQAGERAREAIEAFVRTRLPAGGGDAYGTEELERLNGSRKSRRRFDPYRPKAKPRPKTAAGEAGDDGATGG